ncbi:MAG: hypothetical protein LBL07_02565 [Tannerella sp.]|jgi:hypothetical protein|nr:hypothetical protein [Tannerella sp.]
MNMKKTAILMSFISFGISYSCAENSKSTANLNDMEQNCRYKLLFNALMTPDSLRTAEDKAILQKAEVLVYEGYMVENGRLERTFGKVDLRKRGILEVYYDAAQKDVDVLNNYLDTTSVFLRDQMLEAFMKSRKEYFAGKDSLQLE